ncbi:phospholipase D/nuclease [Poronia punctata]|nr:phospholipase D/nuclease [Poronia punctata]
MESGDPFDGDEEAALRYAIELSLQEAELSDAVPKHQEPIEIVSSEGEDDDLENGPGYPPTPKKSSQQDPAPVRNGELKDGVIATHLPTAPLSAAPDPQPRAGVFQSMGLDRKKMEEERLARAAKRKAPTDMESDERHPRRAKTESHSKYQDLPNRPTSDSAVGTNAASQPPALPYPRGVVKKTWASGYPRQGDIKIEEIFQKDQLELAVLSSFQWDDEWLLSKIDIRKTKIICVAFASNEAHKDQMRANVPHDRIRFCFPPMMPAGSMHSKLQLLKFPTYLRLVIPTGNLVPYDWGETGVMENMVFLIDLPLMRARTDTMGLFGQELCYFLRASGLDENLVSSLSKYDFTETNRYRFVHTIGQSHSGTDWQRTGYCGLGRAVESLGLATRSKVELDFVTASIGSLNSDLLSAIYNAAQGDDGMKEYENRVAGGSKKKGTRKTEPTITYADRFRIYFPSRETVSKSRGGKRAGGTVCLQRKWWESPTFPRELIYDCRSVRPGLLMHSKLLFVTSSASEQGKETATSWAYLGSANLTESAWGRLVKDRATGRPKLSCRNWECGVVIPIECKPTDKGLAAFEGIVPIPMVVPEQAYGRSDPKHPWFFLEA